MKWLLIGLIRVYQLVLSPLLGETCRYYPSCSRYAVEALQVHGAFKGSWLAVRRLHVPPRTKRGTTSVSHRTATAGGTRPQQGA
jgi:uncharacterized protein